MDDCRYCLKPFRRTLIYARPPRLGDQSPVIRVCINKKCIQKAEADGYSRRRDLEKAEDKKDQAKKERAKVKDELQLF